MTKRRDPLSLEDGVLLAHAFLGDTGVESITGKSARLVRMWSDPDDDAHRIPLIQAVRLDRAMVARGEAPPIITVYKAELHRAAGWAAIPGDPLARLADAMTELGDVAAAVRQARCPKSDGGQQITAEEARTVLRELGELRRKLDDLERDVTAAIPAGPRAIEVAS